MPNEAELRADGVELHATGLQHVDVLAEPRDLFHGLYPPARRHADPDRGRPEARPPQSAGRVAGRRRRCSGAGRREAGRCGIRGGAFGLGRRRGSEPELSRARPTSRSCRAAGYEVAYKGKWHLTSPSGEGRGGDRPTRRLAARTASPTGSRRMRARTRRPRISAAASPGRSARAGTRTTSARSRPGSAAPPS